MKNFKNSTQSHHLIMSAIKRAFGKVHTDLVSVNRRIDNHEKKLAKVRADIKELKTSLLKEMKRSFNEAVNTKLANSAETYTKRSDAHLERNVKEMQTILSKAEKIGQKIDNKIKRLSKSVDKKVNSHLAQRDKNIAENLKTIDRMRADNVLVLNNVSEALESYKVQTETAFADLDKEMTGRLDKNDRLMEKKIGEMARLKTSVSKKLDDYSHQVSNHTRDSKNRIDLFQKRLKSQYDADKNTLKSLQKEHRSLIKQTANLQDEIPRIDNAIKTKFDSYSNRAEKRFDREEKTLGRSRNDLDKLMTQYNTFVIDANKSLKKIEKELRDNFKKLKKSLRKK